MMCIVFCMAGLAGCGKAAEETQRTQEDVVIRIGSLKGPTSMGLVYLMSQSESGEAEGSYTFTMAAAADELLPQIVSGELDIALVPANVASVLYHKTKGGISVIDINTLGVLYMVSGDVSVDCMEALSDGERDDAGFCVPVSFGGKRSDAG